jgi:hypothetical protein
MPQPPKVTRVLIPIDSQDPSSWNAAGVVADHLCQTSGAQEVVLLTHTKGQLQHTSLYGFLGAQLAKTLKGGGTANLPSGAMLRSETLQTLRFLARPAVVIAFYADEKMLEAVDALRNVVGAVAVPDQAGGAQKWVDRWGAKVLGQPAQAPAVLIPDIKFEKGLEALTRGINLSHSILNPRDKAHADETLRILTAKGHKADPDKIKSWAIAHGWHPNAAAELQKLAIKIQSLKAKPSLANIHNAQARYDHWS